ncbi:uncharacterized protein LOC108737692 isoform X3 [Agrilus planipennis]|uniref:Uncharacterized protein LOC108737692 isoform X3 n=1 Tax=Agrilus planipennis TaxID=224129 RepID=A0A1W4WQP0_AGRPL|nr:uncharacterized protein LOC108737692 isoform X3 [Agrilus planipennis]
MEIKKKLRFFGKGMEINRKSYGLFAYLLFGVTVTIMLFSYSNLDVTVPYFIKPNSTNSPGVLSALFNLSLVQLLDQHLKFLVRNSKCAIPDLDIWDVQVKPLISKLSYFFCTKDRLLTYIVKENNETKIKIDTSAKCYKKEVECCASTINRVTENDFSLSRCEKFKEELSVNSSVFVKCYNRKSKKTMYKNVHAIINPKDVYQKMKDSKFSNGTVNPLSVLIISIDSVSRMHSHRALPETRKFLEKNGWIELMGYNKVGENTFPNVMAILTGLNESASYKDCNPTKLGCLDKCNMVWYDYRKLGYITAYAEDQMSSSTFNYHKKGFENPPTDYYFRPYMIAAEKELKAVWKDGMVYCTGPETSGERILNIAKDFISTFRENPYFGLFWMNTFSHNALNSVSRMDAKLKTFLSEISNNKSLDNTITIFLSDHGMRFGDIRYTRAGWYEDKLPFFFIRLPPWFKNKFANEYSSLRQNINRLTTPFDLHQTLKHILVLSGKNYTSEPGISCPDCRSLFTPVPQDRSCDDAGIPRTWCTCYHAKEMDTEEPIVQLAGKYIVDVIENWKKNAGTEAEKCETFTLSKVITALAFTTENYMYVGIKTSPEAIFEAPVVVKGNKTHPQLETSIDHILRIDFYGKQTCTHELEIKKRCVCK